MKPELRRILFSLAVLGWSAVLLYFHASGRITKYLAPDFRPIAFAGGLGLAVLGLFNLLTAWQSVDCGHDHGNDGSAHDHETSDVHPLVALLLMILPIGLSVAWTRDEYSVQALSRKGLYDSPSNLSASINAAALPPLTREEMEKNRSRTDDGFYQFNLMELFYATGERELQSVIDGMKVETEGRWIEEKTRHHPRVRRNSARISRKRLGEGVGRHAFPAGGRRAPTAAVGRAGPRGGAPV
jgi:hypothetical protein